MAENDDVEDKLRRASETAKEALDHASGAAMEAARGTVSKATDVKEQLTEAAGRAKERAARRIDEGVGRVPRGNDDWRSGAAALYDRASRTAQTGYQVANRQVAASPMSSLLLAGVLGTLIGWAWRGSVEADRRSQLLDRLPRHLRNRLGL